MSHPRDIALEGPWDHRTVAARGARFHIAEAGDGPLVLLLHGFPESAAEWTHVIPVLAAAGFRAVAFDQRGYSPGARPREVSAYRVGALAADVLAVLDAAGVERAHVVGHDRGGAVAWYLGGRHPERVETLTVLSTPHPRALARSMTRSLQPLRSWYTIAV